jgi:colanic acid biosynthesis glycosyl transferase WcaI
MGIFPTRECPPIESAPVNDSPARPRILVVVNVYRPDLGGGVLFADLCEGLVERGMDVTVRCAVPYYPEWEDKSGENGLGIRSSGEGGVHIERFGLFIPGNPNSFVQRLVYEASFFLSLLRRPVRRGEFDAILVFCPLVGAVAYAGLMARWSRTPLWLNVQDLSAQAAAAGGIASETSLLERVQNALFRRANLWSSISGPMIEALEHVPGAPLPVASIPNWLHASLAEALTSAQPKSDPPPDRPIRLLYSGNIGGKQDLQLFCEQLLHLDEPFEFRIQGAGSRAVELSQWLAERNDSRISMHPLTDEQGLVDALAWADAYVITEKSGAGSSFIPSKLIPGMTSATPILAICDPDGPLGQEVGTWGAGWLASWDDADALPGFFRNVRSGNGIYATWSMNARERGRFYDREVGIDRCAQALNGLMKRNGSTNLG